MIEKEECLQHNYILSQERENALTCKSPGSKTTDRNIRSVFINGTVFLEGGFASTDNTHMLKNVNY